MCRSIEAKAEYSSTVRDCAAQRHLLAASRGWRRHRRSLLRAHAGRRARPGVSRSRPRTSPRYPRRARRRSAGRARRPRACDVGTPAAVDGKTATSKRLTTAGTLSTQPRYFTREERTSSLSDLSSGPSPAMTTWASTPLRVEHRGRGDELIESPALLDAATVADHRARASRGSSMCCSACDMTAATSIEGGSIMMRSGRHACGLASRRASVLQSQMKRIGVAQRARVEHAADEAACGASSST